MSENEEEIEEVLDSEKMETALELGRLVSEEMEVGSEELARRIFGWYKKLTGEIDEPE